MKLGSMSNIDEIWSDSIKSTCCQHHSQAAVYKKNQIHICAVHRCPPWHDWEASCQNREKAIKICLEKIASIVKNETNFTFATSKWAGCMLLPFSTCNEKSTNYHHTSSYRPPGITRRGYKHTLNRPAWPREIGKVHPSSNLTKTLRRYIHAWYKFGPNATNIWWVIVLTSENCKFCVDIVPHDLEK